ncbi:DUF2316 family protein [Streptomyces sp. NBC_00102]|uniref:DUF2316 family protein n=1 Tax=Streptomyces sp. NBC_00102 TaxID=2975652 RepID=UPI0022575180|nr:DUF2316 family protein [Streptomyces sp. NBC_00102]MCX5398940.1 DUF2316 family protein [Streptomyces sp. NBC_00102]
MSLNEAERRRTSAELSQNLTLSGLTEEEAAADLGVTPDEVRRALDVTERTGPVEVWQLRDYLDQAVRDAGGRPAPFTVLTDRARRSALAWFALREAPRHDFTPR